MSKAYFSEDAARRVVAATRVVEGMAVDRGAVISTYRGDEPNSLVIAKTTATWNKGTSATLDRYTGKAGMEAKDGTVEAFNRFATVPAGRWVAIFDGYLIAAEC